MNDAFRRVVEALTNWQRHQWARAGYPGLRERDAAKVLPYREAVRINSQPVRYKYPLTAGSLVTKWRASA